jgi:anaerobic dimethyl sulfoxide reductase subunit A
MTTTALYSDYVLPVQLPFEREFISTGTYGGAHAIYSAKAIEAPGETKTDTNIYEGIAHSIDPELKKDIFGNRTVEEIIKAAYPGFATATATDKTFEEFKREGIISYFPQRGQDLVRAEYKKFYDYVQSNGVLGEPLRTTSGKIEAYCQAIMEDYEARRFYNYDDNPSRYGVDPNDLKLKHIGLSFRYDTPTVKVEGIYTKSCRYSNNKDDNPFKYTQLNANGYYEFVPADDGNPTVLANNMASARFVYPIPMYIPLYEGRHACDDKNQGDYGANYPDINTMRHPDPLNLKNDFPFCMGNYHGICRSHSTNNNSGYVNETFKRGFDGDFAYYDGSKELDAVKLGKGIPTWQLGVLEPLDINPDDAETLNLKTGDTILLTSPRASGIFAANVTHTSRKGNVRAAEGGWTTMEKCVIEFDDGTSRTMVIDIGGSVNTLSTQRPSRICQGSSYGTYQRVKIEKIKSVKLA